MIGDISSLSLMSDVSAVMSPVTSKAPVTAAPPLLTLNASVTAPFEAPPSLGKGPVPSGVKNIIFHCVLSFFLRI